VFAVSTENAIPVPPVATVGTGWCPGHFGELLQGVVPRHRRFLVHLKIANGSRATVRLGAPDREVPFFDPVNGAFDSVESCRRQRSERAASNRITLEKSHRMIARCLAEMRCTLPYRLDVVSTLPCGKGLGSSSADMIASLRAVERCFRATLPPETVSRHLTAIEPNDGLHHDGTVAYHHTEGEMIFEGEPLPGLTVIGIDTGIMIDTVAFNQRAFDWSSTDETVYGSLLASLRTALADRDLATIGRIATESALLWQRFLFKPQLQGVLDLVEKCDAFGVINCHSGSYLGLLCANRCDIERTTALVRERFRNHPVERFQTI